MESIRSTTEMMQAAAAALLQRDYKKLGAIKRQVRGWIIASDERTAIESLLDAMSETAYELESYEAG